MFPDSKSVADLERNMLAALEAVPLESMRRFATRSSRFADAYFCGLNGRGLTRHGQTKSIAVTGLCRRSIWKICDKGEIKCEFDMCIGNNQSCPV